MQTAPPEPSRDEVAEKLRSLIAGEVSRREASLYALQWVGADDPRVEDERVWEALVSLGGCDSPTTDRTYLYGIEDFKAWLHDLNQERNSSA